LLRVVTIDEASRELEERFSNLPLTTETVPLLEGFGRYLAAPVISHGAVPPFSRSTKDGYAVRAVETAGAGETMPALFALLPAVEMGKGYDHEIGPGQAAYVPTGGMIPPGADGVVMIEYSEDLNVNEIALSRPCALGENIIFQGQDMKQDQEILSSGHRLTASDLGAVAACGNDTVVVYKRPRLALFSSGDELRLTGEELGPGCIRDINTVTVAAEAVKMGFDVVKTAILKDDPGVFLSALEEAREEADIIIVSGGSSAGKKDYTSSTFDAMGGEGTFVHGIAFNPGKPTILANCDGFPLVGLPGHPVSAWMVFRIIGAAFIRLFHRTGESLAPQIEASLGENLHAAPGRDTFKPVMITKQPGGEYEARPVPGDSGMITLLSQAQGYIHIPRGTEGIIKGTLCRVYLL